MFHGGVCVWDPQSVFSRAGMLFGIPVVSLWYWDIDQEMAQRVLSAKSLPQARMGSGSAAVLKAVPAFITGLGIRLKRDLRVCVVIPGMVARTLFELCRADETNQTFPEWCITDLSDSKEADKAYPLMVLREFPNGVRGPSIRHAMLDNPLRDHGCFVHCSNDVFSIVGVQLCLHHLHV